MEVNQIQFNLSFINDKLNVLIHDQKEGQYHDIQSINVIKDGRQWYVEIIMGDDVE